ncbi:MAG TPA: hypothetical protein VFA89_12180 [Terriglobales bacterium]|nr:hypothetical protein [Terriglobales bacterium]
MILLITPFAKVQQCQPHLEQATRQPLHVCESLRQAIVRLRCEEYSAVVIDESLLEAEPEESEALLHHMGTAMPVPVNFAVSGMERLIRQVNAALSRRRREEQVARQAVERSLFSELKEPVTAMLLSCELALQVPGLPAAATERIKAVHDLARGLRARLTAAVP